MAILTPASVLENEMARWIAEQSARVNTLNPRVIAEVRGEKERIWRFTYRNREEAKAAVRLLRPRADWAVHAWNSFERVARVAIQCPMLPPDAEGEHIPATPSASARAENLAAAITPGNPFPFDVIVEAISRALHEKGGELCSVRGVKSGVGEIYSNEVVITAAFKDPISPADYSMRLMIFGWQHVVRWSQSRSCWAEWGKLHTERGNHARAQKALEKRRARQAGKSKAAHAPHNKPGANAPRGETPPPRPLPHEREREKGDNVMLLSLPSSPQRDEPSTTHRQSDAESDVELEVRNKQSAAATKKSAAAAATLPRTFAEAASGKKASAAKKKKQTSSICAESSSGEGVSEAAATGANESSSSNSSSSSSSESSSSSSSSSDSSASEALSNAAASDAGNSSGDSNGRPSPRSGASRSGASRSTSPPRGMQLRSRANAHAKASRAEQHVGRPRSKSVTGGVPSDSQLPPTPRLPPTPLPSDSQLPPTPQLPARLSPRSRLPNGPRLPDPLPPTPSESGQADSSAGRIVPLGRAPSAPVAKEGAPETPTDFFAKRSNAQGRSGAGAGAPLIQ